MKQWMSFVLVFLCVLVMLYAGFNGLSNDNERSGLFFIFVGVMTVIGLAIDFVIHLRAKKIM